MAEGLPQIRVRADRQLREASSKVETPKALPLRDATNNTGNGRVASTEGVEGETPSLLPGCQQHGASNNNNNKDVYEAADTVTPARQLPNTKSYPSKLMQTLSGNQAIAASKSPAAEDRKDSQTIDPLSHVPLRVPGIAKRLC